MQHVQHLHAYDQQQLQRVRAAAVTYRKSHASVDAHLLGLVDGEGAGVEAAGAGADIEALRLMAAAAAAAAAAAVAAALDDGTGTK
jgi:hypothetical protein